MWGKKKTRWDRVQLQSQHSYKEEAGKRQDNHLKACRCPAWSTQNNRKPTKRHWLNKVEGKTQLPKPVSWPPPHVLWHLHIHTHTHTHKEMSIGNTVSEQFGKHSSAIHILKCSWRKSHPWCFCCYTGTRKKKKTVGLFFLFCLFWSRETLKQETKG